MGNKRQNKRKSAPSSLGLELTNVQPKTENQEKFFERYDSGKSQLLTGYPGVGKTFLAMYKIFEELAESDCEYNKLVIVRSSVPTRDVGFLPGTLADKNAVYELPYKLICTELFGRGDAYEVLKKHGMIEFMNTSFVRGITLDRAIVLADEVQNYTAHEADSVITRGSDRSKTIFCGDILQRDLTRHSEKDIEKFLKVISNMPGDIDVTDFGIWDIIRGGLVGNYIRKKLEMFIEGF